jgi:CubicO group peptidase (beta-lactamase class C family)
MISARFPRRDHGRRHGWELATDDRRGYLSIVRFDGSVGFKFRWRRSSFRGRSHRLPKSNGRLRKSRRLERLRTAAQGLVDQGKFAGLITLVARRGKVAHFECYGMMDVEANKPMQPDTIFRIYSMTKPITCFALMMFVEGGRLLLDDPVSKFIPGFEDLQVFVGSTETGIKSTGLAREMTIRHLLTHTSGLSYDVTVVSPVEDMYRAAGLFDSLRVLQVPLPEMVQELAALPLAFQPGSDWRYSMAHDVIGYLVSRISDRPFDTFLEEEIFEPLGTDDTGFFVPGKKLDRFAAMYSAPGEDGPSLLDAPATSPFSRQEGPLSGGVGLVSTTSDYLRFAQMLLNGGEVEGVRLLSRETVRMMTTNQLPDELLPIGFVEPWPGIGYGFGFGVVVDPGQQTVPESEGMYFWGGHAGTSFRVDPKQELIALIMPQALHYGEAGSTLRPLVYQATVD